MAFPQVGAKLRCTGYMRSKGMEVVRRPVVPSPAAAASGGRGVECCRDEGCDEVSPTAQQMQSFRITLPLSSIESRANCSHFVFRLGGKPA